MLFDYMGDARVNAFEACCYAAARLGATLSDIPPDLAPEWRQQTYAALVGILVGCDARELSCDDTVARVARLVSAAEEPGWEQAERPNEALLALYRAADGGVILLDIAEFVADELLTNVRQRLVERWEEDMVPRILLECDHRMVGKH
jgi:hypothetical protein